MLLYRGYPGHHREAWGVSEILGGQGSSRPLSHAT